MVIGWPDMFVLEVIKSQTWLPRLLWTCLMPSWVSCIQILNFTLTNMSCLTGRMNGTTWERTSFLLWSQSWEIGGPATDSPGGMRLSSVTPLLVMPSWCIVLFWLRTVCISVSTAKCIPTLHHILVRCPHLQPYRDNEYGNDGVVESFWFYPQLIINLFGETGFYTKLISYF